MFDVDYPAMLGVVQNQDAYAQGVAAQRPFYFDHIAELTDRAFEEFAQLTGRRYKRASGYWLDDADYVIVGQGSVVSNAEAVADWLREAFRPPAPLLLLREVQPQGFPCTPEGLWPFGHKEAGHTMGPGVWPTYSNRSHILADPPESIKSSLPAFH